MTMRRTVSADHDRLFLIVVSTIPQYRPTNIVRDILTHLLVFVSNDPTFATYVATYVERRITLDARRAI
jgi:hypothetical protein